MKSIKLAGIVAFPVLTMLAAGGCSSATTEESDSISLKPAAEAEVLLDAVQVQVKEDGSRLVRFQGTSSTNVAPIAFTLAVDMKTGTYNTKVASEPVEEVLEVQQSPHTVLAEDAPVLPAEMPSTTMSIVTGTRTGRVRVQVLDPCFKVLNQTTDSLTWNTAANGTMTWSSYSDGCAGYTVTNPCGITLTTHWYTTSCSGSSPYYSSGRPVNYASGSYYNTDFGNQSQSTYTSATITLTGQNNGTFTYTHTYAESGENWIGAWHRVLLN
jgi:hypothetical protein